MSKYKQTNITGVINKNMVQVVEQESNSRIGRCINYFNETVLNYLYPIAENVWIAGGSVRAYLAAERITDYDLFFSTEEDRQKVLYFLQQDGGRVVFSNENVDKVRWKKKTLDVCKPLHASPEECISSFDFTVTCAGVYKTRFLHHPDFFIDLAGKRLAMNTYSFPLGSLYRFQKYVKKGYWMCSEEMLKFTSHLKQEDLSDFIVKPDFIEQTLVPSDSNNNFPGFD